MVKYTHTLMTQEQAASAHMQLTAVITLADHNAVVAEKDKEIERLKAQLKQRNQQQKGTR